MPNLWTSTTQKIYEALNGPRTKDTEFDSKVEEIKNCEKSMQGVKQIFFNFYKNTQGTKLMCKDVYANLGMAYSEKSPYWGWVVETCQIYQEIERLYDSMVEVVTNLAKQTVEWDRLFDDAKKNINIREEYRRVYDHYDEKLEKLVKIRTDKAYRNIQETPKEIENFDNNDIKYKKAADDYINQSKLTYNIMCELLDYRYQLINPSLMSYIAEEKKFFNAVSDLFKKFDNLQSKMLNMDRQLKKTGTDYDPRKYVRGYKLLQGVNISELPSNKVNEKKTEKYSYEDYIRSKGQSVNNTSKINNSNINTNSDYEKEIQNNFYNQFKKDFQLTTEQSYVQDKNFNNNNSNNINNNNSSNNWNVINNSNLQNQSYVTYDINKPDDMKKTTIKPQEDFSVLNTQTGQDVFNPYSSLSFNDFTPSKGNMSNFGSMQNNSFNDNRSQFPQTNNQPRIGGNSQLNFPMNNSVSMNYNNNLNNSNMNYGGNQNMNYNNNNYNNSTIKNNNNNNSGFPR